MDFNGIGTSYSAYETKNVSAKSTNDKKADSTDKSSEKSVYSEIVLLMNLLHQHQK